MLRATARVAAPSVEINRCCALQDGKVLRSYEAEAQVNVRLLALQRKGDAELLTCDGGRCVYVYVFIERLLPLTLR